MGSKSYLQLLVLWLCSTLSIASSVSNSETSLTLVYQNNLNFTDDVNHVGFLLLDELEQKDASAACGNLHEKLLSKSTIEEHKDDIVQSLAYISFAGRALPIQAYFVDDGIVIFNDFSKTLSFSSFTLGILKLPVLCTQSATENEASVSFPSSTNLVSVAAAGNTYTGYRNQKSFRFLGIPYADQPKRWDYSSLYTPAGQTINATAYGSECTQPSAGSEDCLFLNIQTPYIPKQGDKSDLRPVMFWIYGGGFTGGSGSDPLSDGGNLASREDIVVVTINYRLSTLGFLAIPGTDIKGNYGIADQITALEWTIKNIAEFGGDPNQITINGESAGAGSVRALLGSPQAIGKFQGAIAMSNLGGGVGLGLTGDYATTYSSYYTIEESYAVAGQNIFEEAGCNQTAIEAQIACLGEVDALTLVDFANVARYVVQDGYYVNTEELIVSRRTPNTAHVPVIFGNAANDGASFSTYSTTPVTSEVAGIEVGLGITEEYAQSIIDSGLFPYYDTGNITLDSFNVSQRVATDIQFRCIDASTMYSASQSGAFSSSYFYQMQRTINGYDPNHLGGPPVEPGFPYGDPNLPYFRLHGADMPWMFGTLNTIRDPADLYSEQLSTGYFAEFVKSGQPNPSNAYLSVRGYTKTIEAIQETGPWEKITGAHGPIKLLDYPAVSSPFIDVPQCAWLKYPLSYYLDGGI